MQILSLHQFVVMKCYVKCYLREDEWLEELWLLPLDLLEDELECELGELERELDELLW